MLCQTCFIIIKIISLYNLIQIELHITTPIWKLIGGTRLITGSNGKKVWRYRTIRSQAPKA
jgi:hypothetical protein